MSLAITVKNDVGSYVQISFAHILSLLFVLYCRLSICSYKYYLRIVFAKKKIAFCLVNFETMFP